jgi:hypothetical protein
LFLLANLLLTSARSACPKLKMPVVQFAKPLFAERAWQGMLLDEKSHGVPSATAPALGCADTPATKRQTGCPRAFGWPVAAVRQLRQQGLQGEESGRSTISHELLLLGQVQRRYPVSPYALPPTPLNRRRRVGQVEAGLGARKGFAASLQPPKPQEPVHVDDR